MSVGSSHYDVHDTIVAIASGSGPSVRGIVRLTGEMTVEIIEKLFTVKAQPNLDSNASSQPPDLHPTGARRYQGTIALQVDETKIDWPCDLWLWPTQRTYTGQKSAEFHLLGAPVVLQQVVQNCCRNGARLAGPGEFTMRAFLAGRLDLIQAEAVLGVIHAQDPQQLQAGLAQLAGGLSHPLQVIREQLVHLLAHLEAGLDFAEEEIEFISVEELSSQLSEIQQTVSTTIQQLRSRNSLQLLPQVLLVGAPNAGKSSLYNHLTEHENAIVSNQRGTTRDFLRSQVAIEETVFDLVDTAGLDHWGNEARDHSVDSLPQNDAQAIAETTQAMSDIDLLSENASRVQLEHADLVILCCDPAEETQWSAWQGLLKDIPAILLWTKSDLEDKSDLKNKDQLPPIVGQHADRLPNLVASLRISVKEGSGIEPLKAIIRQQVQRAEQSRREKSGSIGWRALEQLEIIAESLQLAQDHAQWGGNEELVAAELRVAVDCLGKLVGTIYTDDLLDSIFSRFCIGK